MSGHGYESGSIEFAVCWHFNVWQTPLCRRLVNIDADVAILGAPFDAGTQWRSRALSLVHALSARPLPSLAACRCVRYEDDAIYLAGLCA